MEETLERVGLLDDSATSLSTFEGLDLRLLAVFEQLVPGFGRIFPSETKLAVMRRILAAIESALMCSAPFEKDNNFKKNSELRLEDVFDVGKQGILESYELEEASMLHNLLYFVCVDSGLLDPPTLCERDSVLLRTWESLEMFAEEDAVDGGSSLPDLISFNDTALGKFYGSMRLSAKQDSMLLTSALISFLETSIPSLLENNYVKTWLEEKEESLQQQKIQNEEDENDLPPLSQRAKVISLHELVDRVAILFETNSVKIFEIGETGEWEAFAVCLGITHASCLEWQPLSGSGIALGCASGVLFWPQKLQEQVLLRCGGYNIDHISWAPSGTLLAAGSSSSSEIWIWNVLSREKTALRRLQGRTRGLHWSPSGFYLFAGTADSKFRIWETKTWTCEVVPDLEAPVQAATWSGDGRTLILACATNQSKALELYSLSLNRSPPQINSILTPLQIDLAEKMAPAACFGLRSNYRVRSMCWNETSERLAIMFEDMPGMALYAVNSHPSLSLLLLGFIWGPPGTVPIQIGFNKRRKSGALLHVLFRDFQHRTALRFIPLFF